MVYNLFLMPQHFLSFAPVPALRPGSYSVLYRSDFNITCLCLTAFHEQHYDIITM